MDYRSVLKSCQLGLGLLPVFFAVLGVLIHKHILFLLASALIVVFVCVFPLFRNHANLWAFVFSSFLVIPINVYLISVFHDSAIFFNESVFMDVVMGLICFCVLFSAEQIILGVLTAILSNILKYRER